MPQGIDFELKGFNCSYLDEISLSGLFLRSRVPVFQKSLANNHVTIKKIFSYTVIQPMITNVERRAIRDCGFLSLENTSAERMYSELMQILEWANSNDAFLRKRADIIFEIRVKELKFILANTSEIRLYELSDGFRVLDRYLEFIAG